MSLTIGLYAANMHAAAGPHAAAYIAAQAESLGYDSLWVADHVVLPSPRVEPSPMDPDEHLLDPLVALSYLAAATSRIRLGTGCVVLPQRNPLILAKQLASVDVLSGGRLLFGAATGYLLPELQALGVPLDRRGERANECLEAILSLWYDEKPAFHGNHVDFDGVDAHPRPVQRPVPVVIGGHSRAAHRRAVTYGDEWFGFMLGLRATAEQLRALEAVTLDLQRDEPLRISVCPARRLSPEVVCSFADLGVHRLVVAPPPRLTLLELERFVERNAPERLGATPSEAP
jgi:probable F420-dependent oxidoreductase